MPSQNVVLTATRTRHTEETAVFPTLSGTTATTNTLGVATFSGVSIDVAGEYTLQAVSTTTEQCVGKPGCPSEVEPSHVTCVLRERL